MQMDQKSQIILNDDNTEAIATVEIIATALNVKYRTSCFLCHQVSFFVNISTTMTDLIKNGTLHRYSNTRWRK